MDQCLLLLTIMRTSIYHERDVLMDVNDWGRTFRLRGKARDMFGVNAFRERIYIREPVFIFITVTVVKNFIQKILFRFSSISYQTEFLTLGSKSRKRKRICVFLQSDNIGKYCHKMFFWRLSLWKFFLVLVLVKIYFLVHVTLNFYGSFHFEIVFAFFCLEMLFGACLFENVFLALAA